MDPHLFKAAVEGNIQPFRDNPQNLKQVTKLGDTILHVNIKYQNEAMASTTFVDQILAICPPLLLQGNINGDIPLHVAAKCGHSAMVEILFHHSRAQPGASRSGGLNPLWKMLKMTNNEKNAALHEAVQYGSLKVVKFLTREGDTGFSYSANSYGETPLYLAAARGSPAMVVAILESCRAAAHGGPGGKTALHAAVMRRNFATTAKAILKKKKRLTKQGDQYGWTPLHYAAYYDLPLNAKVLLEFDESAAFIADKDLNMTPLHVASSQGNLKVIENILLHSPQCYELVDARGWNFLHFAMVSLHEEDVDVLLQNPPVRSLIHQKDAKGNTPLHVLAASKRNNSFELNSINLKHESNLQVINRQNISVKHILRYGFPELEQEIQALTEEVCNGQRPRGVICSRRKPISENIFELDPKERDPHLVVAALIATVTLAAAFTVPAGYQSEKGQNQGTAILSRNYHFQTFIIADLIAMFLSFSAILSHFSIEFKFFREVLFLSDTAVVVTIFALIAMVIAFVSGILAVLLPSAGLFSAILCTCIGFCILVSGIMVKVIIDEWREQKLRTNPIETSRNGSAT
ncbi:hypothetical protein Pint_21263 [Pistacia integerrima]|uniref:Uncharacterized protein n=1 Tax=Pistacia integerrima TaxID=434235 RepID=A0ACC0XDC4_9ROSI|nr:hypothetical protein Pint_21263 [Pistacia integerrima]